MRRSRLSGLLSCTMASLTACQAATGPTPVGTSRVTVVEATTGREGPAITIEGPIVRLDVATTVAGLGWESLDPGRMVVRERQPPGLGALRAWTDSGRLEVAASPRLEAFVFARVTAEDWEGAPPILDLYGCLDKELYPGHRRRATLYVQGCNDERVGGWLCRAEDGRLAAAPRATVKTLSGALSPGGRQYGVVAWSADATHKVGYVNGLDVAGRWGNGFSVVSGSARHWPDAVLAGVWFEELFEPFFRVEDVADCRAGVDGTSATDRFVGPGGLNAAARKAVAYLAVRVLS